MIHGEASAARRELDAEVPTPSVRPATASRESFDDLIQSNMSFVAKVASEYRGMGMPFEDLLNEGNVGLVEAAYRFDAARGNKFVTYAVWWIRRSILRALAEHTRVVRLPEYQRKEIRRVRDAEQVLGRELGRRPDSTEISERLSRSVESVQRLMQSQMRELWIDAPIGHDRDHRLSDSLTDRLLPSPEDVVIREQAHLLVSRALALLAPREREVLRFRFGLDGAKGQSLSKVGKRLGLSGERVRQIENEAISRLRQMLRTGRIGAAPPKKLRPLHRI
jgi:RNA polymerase primary sigma factor